MGDICSKRKLMIRKSAILRTHEKLKISLRNGQFFMCSFLFAEKSADYVLFGKESIKSDGNLTQEQIEAIMIMKKVFT